MITNYESMCAICNRPAQNIHHLVFGRSLRHLADEDGLTIPLCNYCHAELHTTSTVASELSRICGQLAFERNLIEKEGVTGDEARERFRKRYSKSYL